MVQTPIKQRISLATFLALPETKPASEYADGEIIQKPMPQGKHSRIQVRSHINGQLETPKISTALTELRCTFGECSTVPDVAVFTWTRIPRDETGDIANTFDGAPDWTVEILSPDQSPMKYPIMARKHYSAEFKAKIALEAIRGLKTVNEIATESGLHPS
jgi:Uma2 family endonuclease